MRGHSTHRPEVALLSCFTLAKYGQFLREEVASPLGSHRASAPINVMDCLDKVDAVIQQSVRIDALLLNHDPGVFSPRKVRHEQLLAKLRDCIEGTRYFLKLGGTHLVDGPQSYATSTVLDKIRTLRIRFLYPALSQAAFFPCRSDEIQFLWGPTYPTC